MDCQERYFNTSLNTFQQEGTYQINVSSLNSSYVFYIIKPRPHVSVTLLDEKKLRIRMTDTPDTCGRKPNRRKGKVADSKISVYLWINDDVFAKHLPYK